MTTAQRAATNETAATTSASSPSRSVAVFAFIALVGSVGLGWLGYQGYRIAERIRGGTTIDSISDPAAPGYRVAAAATPVHLLVVADDEDVAVDFMLWIEGPGGVGGTVVWILGDLTVGSDDGPVTLRTVYDTEGAVRVKPAIELLVGFGISDVTIVGPAEIESLIEPAGSLAIRNPDDLVEGEGPRRTVQYPAGPLDLAPDEVAGYLGFTSQGSAPATRASQAEVVWNACFGALAGVAAAGEDDTSVSQVSADSGVDLVGVARTMATEAVAFTVLPVKDEPFGPTRLYSPDIERTQEALKGVVAAPVSAFPGQRPRVEILNGSADIEAAARVAPEVAAAGAEVVSLGNAEDMTRTVTTVEFHDPSFEALAKPIAALFGVQATLSADQTDARDVTIVLGSDLTR